MDEEVLADSGDLSNYLKKSGFTDFDSYTCSDKVSLVKDNSFLSEDGQPGFLGWIKQENVKIIRKLLTSRLLFDEEHSKIQHILAAYKVKKHGHHLRTPAALSLALCIFCLQYSLLISCFYLLTFTTLLTFNIFRHVLEARRKSNQILSHVQIVKNHHVLLKKISKFLVESKYVANHCAENNVQLGRNRERIVDLEKMLCRMLPTSTLSLVKQVREFSRIFPGFSGINDLYYYRNSEIKVRLKKSLKDIPKLLSLYTIVQSEYIQAIIYCLLLELQTPRSNIFYLLGVVKKLSKHLISVDDQLNKLFKPMFLQGLSIETTPIQRHFDNMAKKRNKFQLHNDIHDLSNVFQKLLIQCRSLENTLDGEPTIQDIEPTLLSMKSDVAASQATVECCIILLHKVFSTGRMQRDISLEKNDLNKKKISQEVETSDSEYEPQDEVFEAYLKKDKKGKEDLDESKEMTVEEKQKLIKEREVSKTVLNELRAVLVAKAKEMEEREAKVLGKASLEVEETQNESESDEEGEGFLPTSTWPLNHFKRCGLSRSNGRIVPSLASGEELPGPSGDTEETGWVFDNNSVSYLQNDLEGDILAARKHFNLENDAEEMFCGSGENSDDDLFKMSEKDLAELVNKPDNTTCHNLDVSDED